MLPIRLLVSVMIGASAGVVAPAAAADMMETKAVTVGSAISASGSNRLESTVGEISYSTAPMAASGKVLRGGHSGTSHSPGAVYGLSASTTALTDARFQWNNGESEGTSYVEIKIATFSITEANYSSLAAYLTMDALTFGMVDQLQYSGLASGTSYYLAIRVRDSSDLYGRITTASFATTAIKPQAPVVSGQLASGQFTLSWPAVQYNTSGSTISLKQYEVYYSTAFNGEVTGPVIRSSFTLTYTVSASPARWYFVKAVDNSNVRSDSSVWLNSAEEVTRTVADDQRAVVDMVPYVQEFLAAAGLVPVMENKPEYETGSTVVSYKFYLRDAANNEVAQKLNNDVTLTMPLSKTGVISISGFLPSVSYSAYDYAAFYYNGVEDINIGGTVNPENGTVSVLTRRTGVYKVKRVIRAQSFAITKTEPRKIFTPNGDGTWDNFIVFYANPEGLDIGNAKVYDLSGAEIAKLEAGPFADTLAWDGRRSNGDKAQSGIYIYQFKAGSKFFNGTMVLAR